MAVDDPEGAGAPTRDTAWFHGRPPHYDVRPVLSPLTMMLAAVAIVVFGFFVSASVAGLLPVGADGRVAMTPQRLVGILMAVQLTWFLMGLVVGALPIGTHAQLPVGDRLKESAALRPPVQGWRAYGVAAIIIIGMLVITFGLVFLTGWTWLLNDLKSGAQLVLSPAWPATFVLFTVCAPLAEELLFRGLLTASLSHSRLGFWPGAMIANVMWTGLHLNYSAVGLAEIAVVGILFTAILAWSGSLRVCIFAHALYNGLLFLIVRFIPLPISSP